MNSRDYLKELKKLAEKYGCIIQHTPGSHYILKNTAGWFVYASRSPSDPKVLRYIESDLRRKQAGVWR